MMAAELRIRTKSTIRTFVADTCRVDGSGWVHAEGRWRHRNGDAYLYTETGAYSWPARAVERIKWCEVRHGGA